MSENVTRNNLENCTSELKLKIEKTRKRLNEIYASDAPYSEKMKVSEELDFLINEGVKQMNNF